ncbi:MAG: right-handed parallel beta-helix repeat-containing protein, partial [Planctomycetota bacterium]
NAVDVKRGLLGLKDCHVSKASYGSEDNSNCVKVDDDAKFVAVGCRFLDSPRFSISTTFHDDLQLDDCDFQENGVQVRGGAAKINDCRFAGKYGVQVQESRDSLVEISNCNFDGNQTSGINVTAGGKVDCTGNTYESCLRGIWVGVEEETDFWTDVSSRSRVREERFIGCNAAIVVSGGIVSIEDQTSIEGGEVGLVVDHGDVNIKGLNVQECDGAGIMATSEAGGLLIDDVQILRCSDAGIWIKNCKSVHVKDSSVENCEGPGITLEGGTLSITNLSTLNVDAGVLIRGTSSVDFIDGLETEGCNFGLYANPDNGHELDFEIKNSRFVGCTERSILASKMTTIRLLDTESTGTGKGVGFWTDGQATITDGNASDSD